MTCPKCGYVIDNDQAVFCPNCGTKLITEEKNQPLPDENSTMPASNGTEEQKGSAASIPSDQDNQSQGPDLNQQANSASSKETRKPTGKFSSAWKPGLYQNEKSVDKNSKIKVILPIVLVAGVLIVATSVLVIRTLNKYAYQNDLDTISEFTQSAFSDDWASDSISLEDGEPSELDEESSDSSVSETDASSNNSSDAETDNSSGEQIGSIWTPLPADPEREEVWIGMEQQESSYSDEDLYQDSYVSMYFDGLSVQPEYVFDGYDPTYCIVNTNNDNLNIRSGPSTDYEIIGKAPKDAIVRIMGYMDAIDDWLLIDYDGTVGWVSSEYLALLG